MRNPLERAVTVIVSAAFLKSRNCAKVVLALIALALAATQTRAQSVYTPYAFTNFAGLSGGPGDVDGIGSAARFSSPSGVAVDTNGNIYVADRDNATIRKITPSGVVTTLAGSAGQRGSADGPGSMARFYYPYGVAVDKAGNVYVGDGGNVTVRKITPDGVVTTLAGSAGQGGTNDGTGSAARFHGPVAVAVDGASNVYVADLGNHTIRKITPDGVVTTLAGSAEQSGTNDGTGSEARFHLPSGVAVDSKGNVYVADWQNNTIRKITSDGVVTTLAGSPGRYGSSDGPGSAAWFNQPEGVAVDGADNVYVADSSNATIRKITPDGVVTTLAGSAKQRGYNDGVGSEAQFLFPHGLAVDSAGNIFVADTQNHTIRKITTDTVVTTLAGRARQIGSADGTGSVARFRAPFGVAADNVGNLYVADTGNHTIRKITPDAAVTTLAGSAGQGGTNDGMGSAARFSWIYGVAVDASGNVYVADAAVATIRKITAAGQVTTLAGSVGQSGTNDGPGNTARFGLYYVDFGFTGPSGVAADTAGNVYVADTGNHAIRKITPDAMVTTLAGRAGQSGTNDGTGSAARFWGPSGLAADTMGNVYVADTWNSAIRKITPDGVVTTLAGSARQFGTNDGTGSAARFYYPYGMAVDGTGNVYVADSRNSTIRRVTPDGVVTTLAGSARRFGDVDGIGGAARFRYPAGVAVDNTGNVFVADTDNDRIAKGTPLLQFDSSRVCPAPSFAAAHTFDAGRKPISLAADDFNGDGQLDLAVANWGANTVSVLLGNGDSTFQLPVSSTGGSSYSLSVVSGDFNSDGKPDLALANGSLGNISVMLGKGDGTFQTAVNYGAGRSPQSVAVGDFNGDGKPDLAVADTGNLPANGSVSVLLGRGAGTFQTFTNYVVGLRPYSIAVADFNGDGKLDLAVANLFSDNVSVLLGNGDATFQPAAHYGSRAHPYSVVVADFNGDGELDLAVANNGYSPFPGSNNTNSGVSVLLGNGDGSFHSAVYYDAGWAPAFLAVGDFNGDGKPDLAINSRGFADLELIGGPVEVLLNTCLDAGLRLAVAQISNAVKLSWPLPYADFLLESTTSLGSTNWQRVSEMVSTNNGHCEMTVPLGQEQRYFRLRKG